eukprot:TRINITY_DN3500_c1_g1_i1.p1 TRINITY_DN3500_c1_g1~~TRINITY_DN3500_c1_g1_i1.p1  ORF type:complete len:137 (+),score=26.58 TRINITY_DN3500_c1_g1_i1:196-606(+)
MASAISSFWSKQVEPDPEWFTRAAKTLVSMEEGRNKPCVRIPRTDPPSSRRRDNTPPAANDAAAAAAEDDAEVFVQKLLREPIESVLGRYPRFRKNFYLCDRSRQRELRQFWSQRDPEMTLLLLECHARRNFAVVR